MNKDIDEYKQKLVDWFKSKEMMELVEVFDGKFPIDLSDDKLLDWLVGFSDIWDYRQKQKATLDNRTGENARWLIKEAGLSKKQKECIENAIRHLGLLGVSKPTVEMIKEERCIRDICVVLE